LSAEQDEDITWFTSYEDVHIALEARLIELVGEDTGGRMQRVQGTMKLRRVYALHFVLNSWVLEACIAADIRLMCNLVNAASEILDIACKQYE
jgi:hypothetical protein